MKLKALVHVPQSEDNLYAVLLSGKSDPLSWLLISGQVLPVDLHYTEMLPLFWGWIKSEHITFWLEDKSVVLNCIAGNSQRIFTVHAPQVQSELKRKWRSVCLKRYVGQDYRQHSSSISRNGMENMVQFRRNTRAQSFLQTETTVVWPWTFGGHWGWRLPEIWLWPFYEGYNQLKCAVSPVQSILFSFF